MCPGRPSTPSWAATKSPRPPWPSRSAAGSLNVKFLDINVIVAPDRQSATADLTVDANISDQPNTIVQEMKFTLRKIGGHWLITRVETVRTLSILNFELRRAPSIV